MRWKSHVRCGAGEKLEIASKIYLSLLNCTLFEGIATNVKEWCKKGDLIGIRGRIQVTDNKMQIIAEKVTFLSSKKQEETE